MWVKQKSTWHKGRVEARQEDASLRVALTGSPTVVVVEASPACLQLQNMEAEVEVGVYVGAAVGGGEGGVDLAGRCYG